MSKKIIVGNWKMNPETAQKAKDIMFEIKNNAQSFGDVKVVICPPFVYLNEISGIISKSKKIVLGAQDVFVGKGVSHTGEVGIDLLKSLKVEFVIVGHSERRKLTDTNEIVKEKLLESLKNGLKVILCVGENERNEHGDHYHEVKIQLENAIRKLPRKFIKNLIVAYEPIWAIGKSEKDAIKPDQMHEISIYIKRILSDILGAKEVEKVKILYGGSITKNNYKEIIEKGNIDGFLIGRESLRPESFLELIRGI